jgi:glycosyltransferase involved in cell wall biosynthesis
MGCKVVACIPAYNEEHTIAKVVLKAMRYVDKVVVCDDGSTDMTCEIAERLGAIVVRHGKNMGYGAAISSLFKKARELDADIMVTLDADGQHNPDDIPRLVKPIVDGEADVVIGSRFLEDESKRLVPKYRRFGIKVITSLSKAFSYKELSDAQSGFRAYSRRALELLKPTEQGMGVSTEILVKARQFNLKVLEVPVKITYDEYSSTQNPVRHGLDVVLSTIKHYSVNRPLVFYGLPGFLALLVAVFFWVWTMQIFTATRQISTNIALVAIGATIVGLVLLTTSIILWVIVSIVREKLS